MEYTDTNSRERNGLVTSGGMGELAGHRLKFDPTDENQGIYFVAEDGSATKVDVVGLNKPAALMFIVPDTLAPGDYTLEVRAILFSFRVWIRTSKVRCFRSSTILWPVKEVDLLRGGTRIQLLGEPPPAPYYVYLSRRQRRPYTQIWPITLRDPLPTVPVPLLPPDPDVPLDLQAAVDACFDLVGYERLLDYAGPPPRPNWVKKRLPG